MSEVLNEELLSMITAFINKSHTYETICCGGLSDGHSTWASRGLLHTFESSSMAHFEQEQRNLFFFYSMEPTRCEPSSCEFCSSLVNFYSFWSKTIECEYGPTKYMYLPNYRCFKRLETSNCGVSFQTLLNAKEVFFYLFI